MWEGPLAPRYFFGSHFLIARSQQPYGTLTILLSFSLTVSLEFVPPMTRIATVAVSYSDR